MEQLICDGSAVLAAIAGDHQDMMARIDHIQGLMHEEPSDILVIVGALEDLVTATSAHFDRENALMEDESDEEFVLHKTDHRYLLYYIRCFTAAIRSGEVAPSMELALDLDGWLHFHTERFDVRLLKRLEQQQ